MGKYCTLHNFSKVKNRANSPLKNGMTQCFFLICLFLFSKTNILPLHMQNINSNESLFPYLCMSWTWHIFRFLPLEKGRPDVYFRGVRYFTAGRSRKVLNVMYSNHRLDQLKPQNKSKICRPSFSHTCLLLSDRPS